MVIQDDYYEGHFIPKGTILFANAWAIHMDEDEYDSPHEHRPERFIADKYGCKSTKNTSDQRRVTYGFGSGRRVCPGQKLAENSLVSIVSVKRVFLAAYSLLVLDAEHG